MNFKKKFIYLIAVLVLATSAYFYNGRILNFKFVDEEENFASGKYLLSNQKLYDDLITNHQPLSYIISAGVQKLSHPENIYLLVSRHRRIVIAWSTIWSLLLVYLFGISTIAFILIFDLTKIYLLGNQFLAESLFVYPFILLFGLTVYRTKRLKKIELFIYGFCLAVLFFLLSPLWPSLAACLLIALFKNKHYLTRTFAFMLLGITPVILLVFYFSSYRGYITYQFINLFYTIPAYQNESWLTITSKSFLTPLLSLLPKAETPSLWVIRILTVLLILNLTFSVKNNKIKILMSLLILGLSNIRYISPGTEGYSGFHFLPWYAAFLFISCMSIENQLSNKKQRSLKYLNLGLLALAAVISINFAKSDLFTKSDSNRDFRINYSTHESIGQAVKIMRGPDDTLFVSPDAWLIYWQSDTEHLPKLFGYYAWMAGISKLHQEILNTFNNNPPTFFYCDNCKNLDLEKFLSKYQEMKQNNNSTRLYVLPEKVNKLTDGQKAKLAYYKFNF